MYLFRAALTNTLGGGHLQLLECERCGGHQEVGQGISRVKLVKFPALRLGLVFEDFGGQGEIVGNGGRVL